MSDADDKLLICNQVLGEIGTRSTMTSVDPPDGSTEAYYCNLLFNNTRDTLLRAAHWNCAGRTEAGVLFKALPGTPENPTVPANFLWNNKYPAPPWLYSYKFPQAEAIQIRRIRGQSQQEQWFYGNLQFRPQDCARFEVANDPFDASGLRIDQTYQITGATVVTVGSGYAIGDDIILETAAVGGTFVPAVLQVLSVTDTGGVDTFVVGDAGSFLSGSLAMQQRSTTGVGIGFSCYVTLGLNQIHALPVILTNAQNILIDFTTSDINIIEWDPGFQNAFMSALEGKLALSLLGDKAMAKLKLEQANQDILEARVRDGNEALTVYDHIPDWLQVRGVASMGSPWVNPPYYGPLFAI
jgi:hypothetical protein